MLKKALHIILACLLLISTSGFSINTHFCQNQLRDLQLFCKAKTCDAIEQSKSCHKSETQKPKPCKKGCCESKSDFYKLDLDQHNTSTEFKPLNISQLALVLMVILNIEAPSIDKKSIHYLNYKPPLIVCDFAPELQVFLL